MVKQVRKHCRICLPIKYLLWTPALKDRSTSVENRFHLFESKCSPIYHNNSLNTWRNAGLIQSRHSCAPQALERTLTAYLVTSSRWCLTCPIGTWPWLSSFLKLNHINCSHFLVQCSASTEWPAMYIIGRNRLLVTTLFDLDIPMWSQKIQPESWL